ncbi:MAG: NAD(P)/FAD-dependent oxidoreductase [Candidatus Izemoplasmatales bacterium]
MHDILIIGAGVIGASVARALSAYAADIVVIEKNHDVCEETSKANSGIVHAGYDAHPGSLKAKYNLAGSRMMEAFCARHRIPYRNNGSMVLAFSEEELPRLEELRAQGEENGVEGLRVLTVEEARTLEPNLGVDVRGALLAPTGAIVDPFELTIAQAEVAAVNGVKFLFDTLVVGIRAVPGGYAVATDRGVHEARAVVNCAGVRADEMNNLVSARKLSITPRKGEYCLFDKEVGSLVGHTLFQLPTRLGKGVLVTPTAEGNLLIGPTAVDVGDKDDFSTTPEGLAEVVKKAKRSVLSVPTGFVITAFAGLRATEKGGDFVIGEAPDAKGFFNAAGIESPGLTSAPAIGDDLAHMIAEALSLVRKPSEPLDRPTPVRFESLSLEEKAAAIRRDPAFGRIVCRCELVTAAEILDAIRRPLGATTVDGIKRRTRAGSGRCQGGFCSPRVMRILAEETGLDPRDIVKFDRRSTILVGFDKEDL